MSRLLGQEVNGGRIDRWWLHTGDDGSDRITVETIEDVEPVIDAVKRRRELPNSGDFRHVATIPRTVIDEVCRVNAATWGVQPYQVFAELMANKTDRARGVWRLFTQGRDYRRFQYKG